MRVAGQVDGKQPPTLSTPLPLTHEQLFTIRLINSCSARGMGENNWVHIFSIEDCRDKFFRFPSVSEGRGSGDFLSHCIQLKIIFLSRVKIQKFYLDVH